MKERMLSVVSNPYSATDADGLPSGVVVREGTDMFVGATLDVEATEKAGGKRRYHFTEVPVQVPLNAYYLRRLKDGDLLPADEETARWVTPEPEFELPSRVLERSRRSHKQAGFPSIPPPPGSPSTPDATHDRKTSGT